MTSNEYKSYAEIRKTFLDFFIKNEHLLIESASLVPNNDPTLLVINSGMAPLKGYFTGDETPASPRLCNIQKCVRTNDIDVIGDRSHVTFFEMMGNWSIGDYFKEKAISLAWELISEVFAFDTSNIYATVYSGDPRFPGVPADTESAEIWKRFLPEDKIIFLGADSNLWGPAGDYGPCGPCTEVFIDRGLEYGCGSADCGPDCDCDRFLEIWNAGVFMEYHLNEDGSLTELPIKSVDAGAGLDRFAVILQGVESIYDTNMFTPIVKILTRGTNLTSASKSIRVIADHIRCSTFMICDNIFPGNSKREYVVRRLVRKALLHSRMSGISEEQIMEAIEMVKHIYSPFYPELEVNSQIATEVIKKEMTGFSKTLNKGMKEFDKIIFRSRGQVSGEDAFRLHDSLGFRIELTLELATQHGLSVDEDGFKRLLIEQQERSRKG